MRIVQWIAIVSAFATVACTQAKFESQGMNLKASAAGATSDGDGYGDATGTITQPVLQQCENTGNFTSSPNSAGRIIVYQSNGSNYSSVIQVGSDNFAQVTQTGTSNVSCIYQSGTNNSATVTQTGNGGANSATTTQLSGAAQTSAPDGQTCLCDLLAYCQTAASAAICQSLE